MEMEEPNAGKAGIPIVVGILVGLLASFVQSLGLTIQRKSHIQNDTLPLQQQKKTYRRPLWLFGFAVFITSNLFGTVFQIGALPIVVLAPLGAVSLLWNAVLSRLLLRERFSFRTMAGTCLIATGASLIAIFGVVPEENHTLEELLSLFRRSGFVVYITLMSVAVVAVLVISHLTEFGLLRKQRTGAIALPEDAIDTPEPSDYGSIDHRRQSIPFRPTSDSRKVLDVGASIPSPPGTPSTPVTRSALRRQPPPGEQADTPRLVKRVHYDDTSDAESARLLDMTSSWKDDRTNTLLGLSFAACSGTLSGMSLLFAKCAVELLILTFASKGKQNQFKSFQSWILLVGLGVTALAQLYYLNYSLRLAGPAVICPLAFCFYNISSIFDGLVFYSQFSELAPHQIVLVTVGIAVLLIGVWSVSAIEPKTGEGGVHLGSWADEADCSAEEDEASPTWTDSFTDEPSGDGSSVFIGGLGDEAPSSPRSAIYTPPLSPSLAISSRRRRSSGYQARYGTLLPELAPPGLPAGFSIGFNTSSPGFTLRTHHQSHEHTNSDGDVFGTRGRNLSEDRGGKRAMSLDLGTQASDQTTGAAEPPSGTQSGDRPEAEIQEWLDARSNPGLWDRLMGRGKRKLSLPDREPISD